MDGKVQIYIDGKRLLVEKGTRLSDAISLEKPCGGNGKCGKCKVAVNGKDTLACRYVVESDVTVSLHEKGEILSKTGAEENGKLTDNACLALDIGTTTLALALVSLDENKIIKVVTATNPQRVFGADVITRVDYCTKKTVKELHSVLVSEINRMIEKIGVESVETMYVAANVTMLHTLFGVDCSSIGVAPYKAVFLEGKMISASEINISGVETIISLPSVHSFVGADIVSGINYVGLPEKSGYNLLIDLGTNAEVVLYSEQGGVATAAAAGPCFEGANISCGMSATDGAIFSFKLAKDASFYDTVGGVSPKGVCGTGLIDVINELLCAGIIDDSGYMDEAFCICENVYITPEDVRQFQLAKSAVCSAVLSLMQIENIDFSKIVNMYISGGFSAGVNLDNAAKCGIFPQELRDKAVVVNNSSLLGCVKRACYGDGVGEFVTKIKYADLSSNQYFSELFIENMEFSNY